MILPTLSKIFASRRWLIPAILGLGVAGFVVMNLLKPRPAVQAVIRPAPLVQVEAVSPAAGGIRIQGSGLVKPQHELVLAAEVSGRVISIHPQLVAGGQFSNGQPLVVLDPAPFEAALSQAQAERASAEASLRLAEQFYARTQELIGKGFLSRQTLDERTSQRDQAAAGLARAEALVESRRIDRSRSTIVAPFTGIVLSQRVSPGEMVQPGRELARIFPSSRLEVTVSLTDREMALLGDVWRGTVGSNRQTQRVSAEVGIRYGSQILRWPARLDRVEAAVDPTTRTYNVVVAVDNPWQAAPLRAAPAISGDPPLLVGMYAQVEIEGLRPGPFAKIPRKALREGQKIWILTENSTLQIRSVRPLYETDQAAFIALEGLPSRFQLITSDIRVAVEGMALRTSDPEQRPPPAPVN
ncbi:MAG: hypothetical protein RLZZ344_1204 [Pseudomonadota bacterium]